MYFLTKVVRLQSRLQIGVFVLLFWTYLANKYWPQHLVPQEPGIQNPFIMNCSVLVPLLKSYISLEEHHNHNRIGAYQNLNK